MNPITKLPNNCVVFDTETTGFEPTEGHRMVEIGALKMVDGLPTKETLHLYMNPERTVPQGAFEVHGLNLDFLQDYPLFADQAQQILDFIGDLPLIAHNSKFDMKFLNFELEKSGYAPLALDRSYDSIAVARKLFPGSPANLDALCRRFKISLNNRDKHGALVDTELLANVIVEMGGGRQQSLMGFIDTKVTSKSDVTDTSKKTVVIETVSSHLQQSDQEKHEKFIREKLGDTAVWAHYFEDKTT
jgi:DNA polymerase-3 subunit epsilon